MLNYLYYAIYNHKNLLVVSWMVAVAVFVQMVQYQSFVMYLLTYFLIWTNLEWTYGTVQLEKLRET